MNNRVFEHPVQGGPPVRLVKRQGGRQSQGLFGERTLRPSGTRRPEFPLCYGPLQVRLYRLSPGENQDSPGFFAFTTPLLQYQPPPLGSGFGAVPARLKPPRRSLTLVILTGLRQYASLPEMPAPVSELRSPGDPALLHRPAAFRERGEPSSLQVPSQAEITRMASSPRTRTFLLRCTGYRIHEGPGRLEESNRRIVPFPPPPYPPALWIPFFQTRFPSWGRLDMPEKPRLPNAFPLIGLPPAEDLPSRRPGLGIQHRQRERSQWLFPRTTFEEIRFLPRATIPTSGIEAVRQPLSLASETRPRLKPMISWRSPWSIVFTPPVLTWRQAVFRLSQLGSPLPLAGRTLALTPPRARWKPLQVDSAPAPGGGRPRIAPCRASHALPAVIRTSPFVLRRLRTLRLDRSFLRTPSVFIQADSSPYLIIPPMPDQPMLSRNWGQLQRNDGLTASPVCANRDLGETPTPVASGLSLVPATCRLDPARSRFAPVPAAVTRVLLPLKRSSARFIPGKAQRIAIEHLSIMGRRGLVPIVPRLRPTPAPDLAPEIPAPILPHGLGMHLPTVPFILLTWHGRFAPHEGPFPRRIRSHAAIAPEGESYRWRPPILLARRLEGLRQFICSLPVDPMAFGAPFRWYFRRIKTLRSQFPIGHVTAPRSFFEVFTLDAACASRALFPNLPVGAPQGGAFAADRLQPQERIIPATRALPTRFPTIICRQIQAPPIATPVFPSLRREQVQSILSPFPFGFPAWTSRPTGFTSTVSTLRLIPFFGLPRLQSGKSEIRLNRHARHRSPTNLRFPRRFLFPVRPPFALIPHSLALRGRFSIFDRRALTPFPAPLPKVFLFAMNRDSWIPKADGYRSDGTPSRMARVRGNLPLPAVTVSQTQFPPFPLGQQSPPTHRHSLVLPHQKQAPLAVPDRQPASMGCVIPADDSLRVAQAAAVHSRPVRAELLPAQEIVFQRLVAADPGPFAQNALASTVRIQVPIGFPAFKARFRVLRFPWQPDIPGVPIQQPTPHDFPDEITIETPDFGSDLRLTEISLPSYRLIPSPFAWQAHLRGKRGSIIGRLKAALKAWESRCILSAPVLEKPAPRDLPPPSLMADLRVPVNSLRHDSGEFVSSNSFQEGVSLFAFSRIRSLVWTFLTPPGFRPSRMFLDAPHFVIAGCSHVGKVGRIQIPGRQQERTSTRPDTDFVGNFLQSFTYRRIPLLCRNLGPVQQFSAAPLQARSRFETTPPTLGLRTWNTPEEVSPLPRIEHSWTPVPVDTPRRAPSHAFVDGIPPAPPRPMPPHETLGVSGLDLPKAFSPSTFAASPAGLHSLGSRFALPQHRAGAFTPRESALPEWIDLPPLVRPPMTVPL